MSVNLTQLGANIIESETIAGITNLDPSISLYVGKFTNDEDSSPEIMVHGRKKNGEEEKDPDKWLTSTDKLIEHYQVKIPIDFVQEDGSTTPETLCPTSLRDFGPEGISKKSTVLRKMESVRDNYAKMEKTLGQNRTLQKYCDDKEMKEALINAMQDILNRLSKEA